MKPKLSIIIPTLNEAAGIKKQLLALQSFRSECEIILVDGGSSDNTQQLALPYVDRIINSATGRAIQMNQGVLHAQGDMLLFLHADTSLPNDAIQQIFQAINDGAIWGRFDIYLAGRHTMLTMVAWMMNWRSRLTSIATGDQALFVTKKAFSDVGQYANIPLMEDINISKKLKQLAKPYCLSAKVISSSRRWQKFGLIRMILLMWWLRLNYFLGRDPAHLALLYKRGIFWKP